MKKLLTFLLTALLAFSVGWAETSTLTFNSACGGSGTADDGAAWTVESDAAESTFDSTKGIHYGTSKAAVSYLTLTSSSFSNKTITKIVVNASGASSTSAVLNVTVGGSAFGSQTNLSSTAAEYTFNGSASGEIVVRISQQSAKKALYCKSITITYEAGGTQPAEPNWYSKVTDLSDLEAGKKCIFVYENGSSSAAMGAFDSNNHGIGITDLTISDNRINIGGTDVIEYTLGGTSNAWTFLNPNNRYLGAAGNTSDQFSTSATLGVYTDLRWTINGNGYISNNSSSRNIRYSSAHLFGLYTSGSYATIFIQDLEDCATPTFSPDPEDGPFTSAQNVSISCATSGATIYYTTDGTTPTTSSAVYSSAITVNETTTIKAIAVASGYDNSAVATATYTINQPQTVANLPAANGLNDGDEFTFTGDAVVAYHMTYGNSSYTWLRDLNATSGGGMFYNDNSGLTSVGTVLNSGWTATKTVYSGLYEYTGANGITANTQYSTQTVEPFDRTGQTLSDANISEIIALNNITISGTGNAQTGTSEGNRATYTLYKKFGITLEDGKKYNIIATVGKYNNNTIQVYPLSATEVAEPTLTIELNPVTQTASVGDIITVNVSVDPADAEFEATCDNDNVIVENTSNGFTIYTETPGTYTVSVYATSGTLENTVTGTYTFNDVSSSSTIYRKVTSTNDLVEGQKYILVYEGTPAFLGAISTTSTKYGLSITGPTINNDKVDIANYSDIKVLTLTKDGNNLSFHNGTGYLCWTSGNSLNVSSDISNNSKWTASGDDTNGFILTNLVADDSDSRILKYNSTSGQERFACYKSGQKDAILYVQDSGETPTPTVAVPTFSFNDEAVTGSVTVNYGETITVNSASGTVISYTTDNTDPSTSNTATLTTSNTAQVMITEGCTIRAIALDGDANESDEATLTVTVNPLAITLNPAEQSVATGETITVDVTANTLGDVVYDYSCSPVGATVTATANGFTITSTNAGTYTVTVSAIDEAYREATAMGTYTFTAASASTTIYRKVTQSSDLVAGRKYIIVYEGSMSSYPNPAVMGAIGSYGDYITGPTISNNEIDIADYTATSVLTLGGNPNDGWTFQLNNGDYMALNSDSNALHTNDGTSNNAKWSVSSSFYLTNVEYDTRTLMSNSASSRFACYTSTQNNQRTYAYLYVQKNTGPEIVVAPNSLSLDDIAVGSSSTTGTLNVSGQKLTENVTVTWDNSNFTVNNSSSPATIPVASVLADGGINVNVAYNGTNTQGETVELTFSSTGAEPVTATVTGKKATPTAPEIDVPTGTYYEGQDVVISAQEGTTLVYTIDGVSTTVNDNEAIIEVPYGTGTTTVTATAYEGNNASETTTVTYTWGTVTVTISPETGTTFMGRTISGTISVEPSDAQVTMTGATYNAQDKTFVSDEVLAVGGQVTVQATATKGNATANATATYTRVAAPTPAAPTFSIPAGAVAAGTQVTITAPAGTTLYVNGVAQSNPYTVTISTATTIQAYCVNEDENTQSDTVTNFYSISSSGGSGDGNIYEKVTSSELIEGDSYILVYEDTPSAMGTVPNGGKGSAVTATWVQHTSTPYQVSVDDACELIAHSTGTQYQYQFVLADDSYLGWSSSTNFNLNLDSSSNGTKWTVSQNGTITNVEAGSRGVIYSQNSNGVFAPYSTSNVGNNGYAWAYLYHKVNSTPTVVVDAPVITPVTDTYYENQNVTITAQDGVTIYYTTDGSNPTTLSNVYSSSFPAEYVSGGTMTVKAIAINAQGVASEVAMETYTWGVPTVSIIPESKYVADDHVSVILSSTPADASIYYTINGSEPTNESTLYSNAFTVDLPNVGDEVTVKAIAYVGNLPSEIATATYTRVNKVIDVNAPFFSPIENYTYYGDQEIEILCTTENADIYYEVVPASGVTVPDASQVTQPTKSSTHYTGPISMTVGNSYYVKAIAYIGNFASEVAEGWFTIKSTSEWSTPTNATTVLENVAQMRTVSSGKRVTFRNPIQVVYMSTMCNDPTPGNYTHPVPEYVYVRDNSGYGVIYFGKGSTMWATQTNGRRNSPAKIFEMGDWIAGNEIEGVTGTWDSGLIPQVGTKERDIYSWPADKLGNTPIIAEEATCADVRGGTIDNNLCGHYLHVRNTTLSGVMDYQEFNTNETNDYRHTGTISDASGACTYYDRFWLYSGTVDNGFHYPYTGYGNITYDICGLGHYDQAWFTAKGDNATFDIFCVGDYYAGMSNPYEVFPLDFLWIYKPVISLPSGEYTTEQTVTLTAEQPTWTEDPVTIYYKTDDMDDWAEYTSPIIVNSDTHIQAYAQVPTEKFNDIVRSVTVEATYEFANIKEPIINDDVDDNVIEVTTGDEEVNVTIQTNPESPEALTLYTLNGEVPTLENGIPVVNGSISLDSITETTTVTAISYLPDGEGNPVLWSNPVTVTYTFVKSNGVVYNLVDAVAMDKVYVIVNKDAYMGLSTAQNGNNRGSTGVKFTDGTKEHVYGNDELALFVLESANAGRYYFKNINGNGYLTVTTNDVANLSTSATASSYSEAAVAIGSQAAGCPATITFNYDGTNRYLRYFAKGRTFTTNSDVTLNQDVFLYGTTATPLAVIESKITAGDNVQVTVADNLIGAWAINKPDGKKYLWAKDMGLSIDKTAPVAGQKDYVKNILHYQNHDWDQSNWVILDFSGLNGQENNPEEFVGKKLTGGTITGKYVDGNNYRIVLDIAPQAIADADAGKYPGYNVADVKEDDPQSYVLGYNTYIPTNFYDAYMNAPYGEGFVAEEGYALGTHAGEKLFFMNPKVQEVVRIWGIYTQKEGGQDVFTCITPSLENMVNGWGIKGAFAVKWDYNRVNQDTYGARPSGLGYTDVNKAFMFHAAIVAKSTSGRRANVVGTADDASNMSDRFVIYPLDFKSSEDNVVTGVEELNVLMKDVESVRYYNIMGMESEKPFEGINIVVTRYTDGSTSTAKILR